ncbi:MAG TPA: hypothetical protein VNQ90_06755 [Chthoniobacteraceae bacterium]|nr:hypothetical protein [Chthoniobacteraceae bacterium]
MALSVRQLALRLAKHIGVSSFDPADPSNADEGLQPGDVEECVACLNAALAELWQEAPTILCRTQVGVPVRAPLPVGVTVSEGSGTVTAFALHAAWMDGCAIRIEGDAQVNEIVDAGNLRFPYLGATAPGGAAKSAVVYGDFVTAPPGVKRVLDPVFWNGGGKRLQRVNGRGGFEMPRREGVPLRCSVEPAYESGALRVGLRLDPLPTGAGLLSIGARLVPPTVTESDIGVASDPQISLALPGGWDEAVVLPLALSRISMHPRFEPANVRTEIARQATIARRVMNGSHPDRRAARCVPTFR